MDLVGEGAKDDQAEDEAFPGVQLLQGLCRVRAWAWDLCSCATGQPAPVPGGTQTPLSLQREVFQLWRQHRDWLRVWAGLIPADTVGCLSLGQGSGSGSPM